MPEVLFSEEHVRPGTYLPLLLALALGLLWTFFIYHAGLRFSPDSCVFMSHALDMHHNLTFSCPVNRAPLYIVLLSLSLNVIPFPGEAAALLSGLSMIAVLLLFCSLCRRFTHDAIISALLVATLFTWPGALYVYTNAWTEPTYTVFSILSLWLLVKHYDTQRLYYFALAALATACVPLTRFIGYSLLAVFLAYSAALAYKC